MTVLQENAHQKQGLRRIGIEQRHYNPFFDCSLPFALKRSIVQSIPQQINT